jgi:hypothetical protein
MGLSRVPRIALGIIAIAALLAVTWALEAAYDKAHLRSGPNAWFIVQASTNRASYTTYGHIERVLGNGFRTQRLCDDALAGLLREPDSYLPLTCRALLLKDAAKLQAPANL